jgi:hypothetical protein
LVIAVAWVLGLLLNAIVLRRDAVLVAIYNRKTWAKLLLLLQLAYAPLAENIIGVFACREIDGEWWLQGHVDKQCYTPEHRHYTSLGAFWAALYVAGTPALFLATLVYYRIPAAAKYLGQLALLRQTVDIAWQRGVKMPEVNTSIFTLSNITDDHIDALYNGLVRRSSRVAADGLEDALTGEAAADEEEEYEEDKDAKTSADKSRHTRRQASAPLEGNHAVGFQACACHKLHVERAAGSRRPEEARLISRVRTPVPPLLSCVLVLQAVRDGSEAGSYQRPPLHRAWFVAADPGSCTHFLRRARCVPTPPSVCHQACPPRRVQLQLMHLPPPPAGV